MDACLWIDGYADLLALRFRRERPDCPALVTDSPTVMVDWRPLTGNGAPVSREEPMPCALFVRRSAACDLLALRDLDVLALLRGPDYLGLAESIAAALPRSLVVITGQGVYEAARLAHRWARETEEREWEVAA